MDVVDQVIAFLFVEVNGFDLVDARDAGFLVFKAGAEPEVGFGITGDLVVAVAGFVEVDFVVFWAYFEV